MAGSGILGLVVLAVVVPLAYGAGCTAPFYMYGDICLTAVQTTKMTWADARTACKGMNADASLAVVEEYATQAYIVAIMKASEGHDVYIGLKNTPTYPSFHWDDDFNQFLGTFSRWGVGQPDGYPILTDKEYCVVADNTNSKRPGRWYDVLCTEEHYYICSMPLDPDVIDFTPPVRPRCPGDEDLWYGYAAGSCFYLEFESANFSTYDEAKQKCEDLLDGTAELATVLDGYESALMEGIMHGRGISSAWIGLASTAGEFSWETGYPIEFTNWGTNEPSGQAGEGCTRARANGLDWDDATCADTSAFFCRYNSPPLRPPNTTPPPGYTCPSGWESFGTDCYYFPSREADWGEANFRCMQEHGSILASITSDAERQFIYDKATQNQGGPSDDGRLWIGLNRVQTSNGDWGTFGFVDGQELSYVFWDKDEPNGFVKNAPLIESCVSMTLSNAGLGAWSDEVCQFSQYRYVCKLPQQATYEDTICPGDTNQLYVRSGDSCYMPSTATGVSHNAHSWTEAENFCRENFGHLISIHSEEEQLLARKLSYSFALSYWIGLRQQDGDGVYKWSDGTNFDGSTFTKFTVPTKDLDIAGEEDCAELLIWEYGNWETSACGVTSPFICKRGKDDSAPIGPIEGYPDTGTCPQDYFKLGNMCFNFRGVDSNEQKEWIDARDDCRDINSGGTLATVSDPGQQALLTSIIKVLHAGTDLWIGLNGIGVHDQYHWTDGTPLQYTKWMEGQPDNSVPIDDPNSQTCVVMMNYPNDPGSWNDVFCSIKRAYLCQTPLIENGAEPPTFPGDCTDDRYTGYFDTCLRLEQPATNNFDNARSACQAMEGDLLSPFDKYEMSFLTASLYTDGIPDDAEAWVGMRRNPTTNAFEWVDDWPLVFTNWGPNEPNNNAGDCVVLTRGGYMAVRSCTMGKNYFCEYPTNQEKPSLPDVRGGDCYPGYVEIPDTDYCMRFETEQTMILQEEGDFKCAKDYDGGRLPSVHSRAEDDFIKAEAKKVFTSSDAKIWLGMSRDKMGYNNWLDGSLLDYVNWITGQPSTTLPNSPGCVALDLNGGWADIGCDQRANFVCKTPKLMKPPTTPKANSADRPATALPLLFLLSLAALLMTRR